MARRRSNQRAGAASNASNRGTSLSPAARGAHQDSAADALAATEAPDRSIVDFLTVRIVLIASGVLLLAAVIALGPESYYRRLQTKLVEARRAQDHELVLSCLKRMDAKFGCEPLKNPNSTWGRLVTKYRNYLHISTGHRIRYHTEGSDRLANLGRYEEAAELLSKINPKVVPNTLNARILYETGQREEAIRLLTAAPITKRDVVANFYVGRDLHEKGFETEAVLYLTRCAKDATYGEEARGLLGAIRSRLEAAPAGA